MVLIAWLQDPLLPPHNKAECIFFLSVIYIYFFIVNSCLKDIIYSLVWLTYRLSVCLCLFICVVVSVSLSVCLCSEVSLRYHPSVYFLLLLLLFRVMLVYPPLLVFTVQGMVWEKITRVTFREYKQRCLVISFRAAAVHPFFSLTRGGKIARRKK